MATSSSSAALVNFDAGTPVRDPILVKGLSYLIQGTYEKVAGNTNGDYIALTRVGLDWNVASIKLNNDTITSLNDVNVGLIKDEAIADGPTDVDENCYADAIDMTSALAWAEQAFEARDVAACGQYVWQDAGYSTLEAAKLANPTGYLRIALHLQAAATATGTISWQIGVVTPG